MPGPSRLYQLYHRSTAVCIISQDVHPTFWSTTRVMDLTCASSSCGKSGLHLTATCTASGQAHKADKTKGVASSRAASGRHDTGFITSTSKSKDNQCYVKWRVLTSRVACETPFCRRASCSDKSSACCCVCRLSSWLTMPVYAVEAWATFRSTISSRVEACRA